MDLVNGDWCGAAIRQVRGKWREQMFRFLDSLTARQWVLYGGGCVTVAASAAVYESYRRATVSAMLRERDCLASREIARYRCDVLDGFDVVVRNYFYKTPKPHVVRTPFHILRDKIHWWFSSETNDLNSRPLTQDEKEKEIIRLKNVVTITGEGGAPRAIDKSAEPWPVGSSRYCGMTIEPSRDGGQSSQVAERGFLRALIDKGTQQTLVKCPHGPSTAVVIGTDFAECDSDPSFLSATYLRTMIAAFALMPSVSQSLRVGVVGVGGGALPMFVQQYFAPRLTSMDLVDVEPQVIHAACTNMGLRRLTTASEMRYFVNDALTFLGLQQQQNVSGTHVAFRPDGTIVAPVAAVEAPSRISSLASRDMRGDQRYDVLFVDTFVGSEMPPHLDSTEFVSATRNALTMTGVTAFNLPERNDSFVRKCASIYGNGNVIVAPCRGSANHVIFALRTLPSDSMHKRHIMGRIAELQGLYRLPYDVAAHFPLWWNFV